MNKLNLVALFICATNAIIGYGQKPAIAEKNYYAYLLVTSDLDVKVTVLNNQNSFFVKTTDELVKIGLDAGDNIIKITPLDGGTDAFTITKTADKPGNIAYRIEVGLKRSQVGKQELENRIKDSLKIEVAKHLTIFETINKNMVLVNGGVVGKCYIEYPDKSGSQSVTDFYISKTEVTQEQWTEIMGYNPSYHANCSLCPVENITLNEINVFIDKLNNRSNLKYKLPSEWEWKFANNGGNLSDGRFNIFSEAWYSLNSDDSTHQVMLKDPNELGLFDMLGNVFELIEDFTPDYERVNCPLVNGTMKVLDKPYGEVRLFYRKMK
jgi:hypothetical protein